ncbi:hypothetical protein CABS01_12427, partial [Colletotrichum abscissum]|uniref:uncharacterized protein n=1 Tax=Colletotrichum abscissum TaxID=1671311 RepID=UPI0027D4C851
ERIVAVGVYFRHYQFPSPTLQHATTVNRGGGGALVQRLPFLVAERAVPVPRLACFPTPSLEVNADISPPESSPSLHQPPTPSRATSRVERAKDKTRRIANWSASLTKQRPILLQLTPKIPQSLAFAPEAALSDRLREYYLPLACRAVLLSSEMSDGRSDSGLGLRFLDLNDDEDDNSPCKGRLRRSRSQTSKSVPVTPHASSPQISTPSLPSPMSYRGFSPLSPTPRQQFSTPGGYFSTPVAKSPLARSWTEDDLTASTHSNGTEKTNENTENTRDTLGLIQRLNDLAQKLLAGEDVPDTNVSAMHGKLDEIDSVLAGEPPQATPQGKPKNWPADARSVEHESLWTSPSPSWFRSGLSEISPSFRSSFRRDTPSPEPTVEKKPAVDTFRIASEAAKLNIELESLVTNLKARQEESEHIHQLLVTRAERAAQRIIFLQGRVHDLEEELQENDSELSYLRLGLKAIEVQCPTDVDDDLAQSIQNWKTDWTALKRKRSKHKSYDRSAYSTPAGTPLRR